MSLFKAKILISNALRVNFIMRYTVQHLRLVPINSYTFIYSYTLLHIHACTHIHIQAYIHTCRNNCTHRGGAAAAAAAT